MKNHRSSTGIIWMLGAVMLFMSTIVLAVGQSHTPTKKDQQKISRFGEYSGYSERKYDGYDRESRYVAVRDGTRLAVDIFYPTKQGKRAQEKLPALFHITHYGRAKILEDGSLATITRIEDKNSQGRFLLEHGYVIVSVDIRGSGASFGHRVPTSHEGAKSFAQDSYDVIEWAARQSWCTGAIGMFGGSFHGHSQTFTAAANPPALKAITPNVTTYYGAPLNGVVLKSILDYMSVMSRLDGLENGKLTGGSSRLIGKLKSLDVAPVDGPRGESLLQQAREEHRQDQAEFKVYETPKAAVGFFGNSDSMMDLWGFLDGRLKAAKVPSYYMSGLYDAGPDVPLLYYANLTGPRKALVGPWTHGPDEPNDAKADAYIPIVSIESLRWLDYWVKGIENGIMDEPKVHYSIIDKDVNRWAWMAMNDWPADQVKRKELHFGLADGKGRLNSKAGSKQNELSFTVDYSATSGDKTRWWDGNGMGPLHYPEMSEVNKKGILFTSNRLEDDIAIAGAPIVSLSLTATAAQHQIHVYLEKVRADGSSEYVTSAAMHTSWRNAPAPYDSLGWPFLDGSRVAMAAAPSLREGITNIKFRLIPAGMVFEKGSRIRVLITGADADNFIQEPLSPAPDITVMMGPAHSSKISLPIVNDINQLAFDTWPIGLR